MASASGRSSSSTQHRLLIAALAQQEGALAKLLELYRASLLGLARRKLKTLYVPGQSGSDVVQDVFARAVRHFSRFRGDTPAQFAAWLNRILQNRIIDLTKEVSQAVPASARATVDGTRKGDPSPSSQVRRLDAADRLRRLVANMPEPYRGVVLLRYVEGVEDFATIGEQLGRTENTVRQQWRRGLKWLHDQERLHELG